MNNGKRIAEVSPIQAAGKMLGFQPSSSSRYHDTAGIVHQNEAYLRQVKKEIETKWAQSIVDKDLDATRSAMQDLKEFNAANPHSPIRVSMQDLQRQVRELQRTPQQRIIRSVRPERRAIVASDHAIGPRTLEY